MPELREQIAQAMFEKDEPAREAVSGISRMAWSEVGEQYRNNWRERADAALAVIEEAPISDAEVRIVAGRMSEQCGCLPEAWQHWAGDARDLIAVYRRTLAARLRKVVEPG